MHSQFSVLFLFLFFFFFFLFLFCFFLFCSGHSFCLFSYCFRCLFYFFWYENRRTWGSPCPLTNAILNEKGAQIMTSSRNEDNNIIFTCDTKNKRTKKRKKGKKEKKKKRKEKSTKVEEVPEIWTRERLQKNRKQIIITFFFFLYIKINNFCFEKTKENKRRQKPQNRNYFWTLSLGSLWILWSLIRPINYHQITCRPNRSRSMQNGEQWQCVIFFLCLRQFHKIP